jgi:DNA-binding transcriptional regulator GbsR (MarR family)
MINNLGKTVEDTTDGHCLYLMGVLEELIREVDVQHSEIKQQHSEIKQQHSEIKQQHTEIKQQYNEIDFLIKVLKNQQDCIESNTQEIKKYVNKDDQ